MRVSAAVRHAEAVDVWDLEPGEYFVAKDAGGRIVAVWARLPNGDGPCELHEWSPVEHEDGSLTLSPSILSHPSADPTRAGAQKGWHGFLERDIWREV